MFLGADINRIDEDQFSVFAPDAKALKEAVDRISEIAMIKVTTLGSHYGAHAKNCLYLKIALKRPCLTRLESYREIMWRTK